MEALRDIAAGRGVRRADHELVDEVGHPCVDAFHQALADEGFVVTTVGALDLPEGERVPAWLVEDARARFGHIFWERFSPTHARKLWGSVHKNAKGDWDRIIGVRSRQALHADATRRERVDPENPSGW